MTDQRCAVVAKMREVEGSRGCGDRDGEEVKGALHRDLMMVRTRWYRGACWRGTAEQGWPACAAATRWQERVEGKVQMA